MSGSCDRLRSCDFVLGVRHNGCLVHTYCAASRANDWLKLLVLVGRIQGVFVPRTRGVFVVVSEILTRLFYDIFYLSSSIACSFRNRAVLYDRTFLNHNFSFDYHNKPLINNFYNIKVYK